MTPAELARRHAECFVVPPPWSEAAFAALLAEPAVALVTEPEGFALGRVVLDEAEVLTIAVAPAARKQGVGQRLLTELIGRLAGRGATSVFLEVATGNVPALALYRAAGFAEAGRRRGYYLAQDGRRSDAVVMRRDLGARRSS